MEDVGRRQPADDQPFHSLPYKGNLGGFYKKGCQEKTVFGSVLTKSWSQIKARLAPVR
jgi:hypothetical protein